MASGMEMMLVNMLKAFMPKESAEKIAGWASDGTFDRIGELPAALDEIRQRQARLELGLARIYALLSADAVPGDTGPGLGRLALAEHRADGGPGSGSGTGGELDNGHGDGAGEASSVGEAAE